MNAIRQSSDLPRRTAVVAGATGLVGGHLVAMLNTAADYAQVTALTRRPLPPVSPKVSSRTVDFDRPERALADVSGTGALPLDVFCALGTTIKTAGSQDAFRRVDFDYVLNLARWSLSARARRFIVVSALAANAGSAAFYNRVKGEMEDAVRALALPVVVLRPSLLAGHRDEFRAGERLALALTAPLRPLIPASVRPVQAADVAATMLQAARDPAPASVIASANMHGARRLVQLSRHPST
jgi:uncharacterized protein YbjT (DUF2867 family)